MWSAILKTNLNEIWGYQSGTFSLTKENYNTMGKEILAITRGTKKQIQQFLRILNYASSYIPNVAKKKKYLQSC